METKLIEMSEREETMPAGQIRLLGEADWISNHASGSLQKAKKLGFSYRSLYLEERVAHDFGWTFKVIPKSRITFGDALMEGDNPSLTETCWFALRIMNRNHFPDTDYYELKYIKTYHTDLKGEEGEEGIGLILRQSSAMWLPKGHLVYSIIAEWDGKWKGASNPC